MKLILFVLFLWASPSLLAKPVDTNVTGTIHLYAAVNGRDPEVGEGCMTSWKRLEKLLKDVRPGKERLEVYRIPDRMASRADVLLYYSNTIFKPNDVLWFFYCGHGHTQGGIHMLDMDGRDSLSRPELRAAMEAKKRQGVLITTDACGTKAAYAPPQVLATAPAPGDDRWNLIASLIGNLFGTVDITAATGENPAFIDFNTRARADEIKGALFTTALEALLNTNASELDLNRDTDVDWTEAFAFLRERTRRNFSEMRKEFTQLAWNKAAPGSEDQVPYHFGLGKLKEAPLTQEKPVFISFANPKMLGANYRFSIRADFHNSLKDHELFFGVYLYDGLKPIASKDPKFADKNGNVAFITSLKLNKDNLVANDNNPIQLDIPMAAMGEAFADSYVIYAHDLTAGKDVLQSITKFFPE